MNLELAQNLLSRLQDDREIQNYIAQANARYILFNVKEPIENFPKYTPFLDDRLNQIAIKYLSSGCSFAENKKVAISVLPLETAAKILENVHRPQQNRLPSSTYYLLISSLSYYAASQYSKSFIIINQIETSSKIANMFAEFLRKDYTKLMIIINGILLNEEYFDDTILRNKKVATREKNIFIMLYAKCFSNLIEFIFSGNDKWLFTSKELITDIIHLSELDNDPATWWTARLFKIILNGFLQNSTWKNLGPTLGQYNEEISSKYILNLAFSRPHIVELFITQRESLEKILNPDSNGAVISLPTSSGKTRIAEIAIIDLLVKEPSSKILYIAPFRSLAFEIEESFENSFSQLGFITTHLYGGSQFSKLDETLISESSIIIATPEKSKAIIRTNPELAQSFKLVIIDEGHLLGDNERYILSELLIEELKLHLKKNSGKIFLLSAVLPNVEDISRWITNDPTQVVVSNWRPSNQRFGYLEWTGKVVNLRWPGTTESFNNNFIKQIDIKRPRSIIKFPSNKKEAVATTAVKLMDSGTVLIFVGKTNMVISQARSVLHAMSEKTDIIEWENEGDWNQFLLTCEEAFGPDSELVEFAKYGILCHSSKIPQEVRISMERLIRFGKPKIIISTNTLGQGVNLRISTVIFSNLYLNHNEPIGLRDFWNIAGRAGRAFIDTEGKILFMLDRTNEWNYIKEKKIADSYLQQINMEKSQSGLLILIKAIKSIAQNNNMDFELLLQLISENDWDSIRHEIIENDAEEIAKKLDQVDDSILSLNIEYEDSNIDANWIEEHFKNSLAYIQAERDETVSQKEVLEFISARNEGIKLLLGDVNDKRAFIKGSLPLRACSKLFEILDPINVFVEKFLSSDKEINNLVELIENIETLIVKLPTFENIRENYSSLISELRALWISGESLHKILQIDKKHSLYICSTYFGYKLPFILNAISKGMKDNMMEDSSIFISELAILCELGLPNMLAAKIYLAGIKSRVAALQLSENINEEAISLSIRQLQDELINIKAKIKDNISANTYAWVNLLEVGNANLTKTVNNIPSFSIRNNGRNEHVLGVRSFQNELFLCSPDYNYILNISDNELKLGEVADMLDVNFIYDEENEVYCINIRNPRIEIK